MKILSIHLLQQVLGDTEVQALNLERYEVLDKDIYKKIGEIVGMFSPNERNPYSELLS